MVDIAPRRYESEVIGMSDFEMLYIVLTMLLVIAAFVDATNGKK